MSIEADLETAVIASLRANITALADKTIDAYSGQTPQEWLDSRVTTDPACMVHVGDSSADTEDESVRFLQTETEFYIYVMSRNIRSEDERRTGIYDILQDIRTLLHGQFTGNVMFRLAQQGPAFIDQKMSVYFQRYLVNLNLIG